MGRRGDFTLQDLLGTFDRQVGYLGAQSFAGLGNLLLGFGFGLRNDAVRFGFGVGLDFFSHQLRTLLGVRDALGSFVAGGGQGFGSALFSAFHRSLALVGRSQTIGDTLGTLKELLRTGGTELLVIEGEKEDLVPVAESICTEVDIVNKRIVIDPPEGLLDF